MPVVLGLDAAWTDTGPSGVALVESDRTGNRVVAIAPSYESFLRLAANEPIDWQHTHKGCNPAIPALIDAANALAGTPVDVIVADIPLSLHPISARRPADDAISKAFGGRGCSTHTPSADRPGPLSEAIRKSAEELGYRLATGLEARPARVLLETYPHPAILGLTGASYRVPYKVQKISKYWPELDPDDRRSNVSKELNCLVSHLKVVLGDFLLNVDATAPVRSLKCVEDVIDALVCCWVGCRWADNTALPYGDQFSAIWLLKVAGTDSP